MFNQKDAQKLIHNVEFHKFIQSYIKDDLWINIYIYGSVAYGCKQEYDDLDLIIITEKTNDQFLNCSFLNFKVDLNFIDKDNFDKKLKSQEISAIECACLNDEFKIELQGFPYEKNIAKLRSSISEKASHSFVKAKKKFIDGEYYIAKKSLWHSLRILSYGISIAKNGYIDYEILNELYKEIVLNTSNDYNDYLIFKKRYNELSSEFKLVAPK